MTKCIQYDEKTDRCRSGFVRIFGICRGMVSPNDTAPYCMRDETPEHLTRDDGLPIGWPICQAEGGKE